MQYNAAKYNTQRYNINGAVFTANLSDSVAPTEATDVMDVLKVLNESISFMSTTVFNAETSFFDIVLIDEIFSIQVTNKSLMDAVRLADWLSIRRTNTGEWFS